MAYEVTATRKRPQDFGRIVGQEFVVATLASSIEQGRIAHAYLFAGPRGVGKTSAARILAKALNCEKGPTAKPCGECSACREIGRGASLDVIEIDGASNTSVNDVREIRDEVLFRPNSYRYKVYIIDEVHMLSNSAFNALLKTIEEPPPYVVFIFATTEIHRVPATIRSRCQQFNFRLISTDDLKASLARACSDAGIEAEEAALLWMAKEATGSLRDAYTLFDQVASFAGGRITLALIREKLGIVGLEQMNELVAAFLAQDARRALELVAVVLEQGVAIEQVVTDLAEYFRCVLFLQHGVTREGLLGYPASSFVAEAVQGLRPAQIEKAIELLLDLHRNLRFSLNQRFELELVVSRLARIRSFVGPEDVLAQIRRIREEMAGGVAPIAPPPIAPPAAGERGEQQLLQPAQPRAEAPAAEADGVPDERTQDVGLDARKLVDALRRKKPALASAMDKAVEAVIDGNKLRFVYRPADRYSVGLLGSERVLIESFATEVLGRPVKLEVVSRETGGAGAEPQAGVDEKAEMVKRVFKGQLINGG
jgi:DNA polymerase III subunit gamma/tau